VKQFKTEASARKGIAGLIREINFGEIRFRTTTMTVGELVDHYRLRELMQDNTWKSYSTKRGYESYLKNWIVPHWGKYKLHEIKTVEVETWLRGLPLAKSSSAKIRNIFSVLFNHACRYDLFERNPITLVRHSAKRCRIPDVLTVEEAQRLLSVLAVKERTMVLMALGTGLRRSELFALKWKDVDFASEHISVTRSIVNQVVGTCKTEPHKIPCLFTALWPTRCLCGADRPRIANEKTGSSLARNPKESTRCGPKQSCDTTSVPLHGKPNCRSVLDGTHSGIRIRLC
jgi:hypothetical protein